MWRSALFSLSPPCGEGRDGAPTNKGVGRRPLEENP